MDEIMEVADLEKTQQREELCWCGVRSIEPHKGGVVGHFAEPEPHIAEDAHLDAAYEDRFEPTFDPLEAGEWYEEPWWEGD